MAITRPQACRTAPQRGARLSDANGNERRVGIDWSHGEPRGDQSHDIPLSALIAISIQA